MLVFSIILALAETKGLTLALSKIFYIQGELGFIKH